MKRFSLITIIIIFIGAQACNTSTSKKELHWQTYKEENFSIEFPENWKLDKNKDEVMFILIKKISNKDPNNENINLTTKVLSDKSYEEYIEQSKKPFPEHINYTLDESKQLSVNNINGHKLSFTRDQFKFVQYFLLQDETVYILTYTGKDSISTIGEKIMNSFVLY